MNKITNIEDAVKLCHNKVTIYGWLKELNIDTIDGSDANSIIITYKGVVDIGNALIKFYGKDYNTSSTFASTVDTLDKLEANIKTISCNGEIQQDNFGDKLSVVYLEGSVRNSESIRCDYIATSHSPTRGIYGDVVGVALKDEDQELQILIINEYHNIIKLRHEYPRRIPDNTTVSLIVDIKPHESMRPDMFISVIAYSEDQIDKSVIDQALLEHEIYISTFSEQ